MFPSAEELKIVLLMIVATLVHVWPPTLIDSHQLVQILTRVDDNFPYVHGNILVNSRQLSCKSCSRFTMGSSKIRATTRRDNWGEGVVYSYSFLHTVKTIAFKRNPSGRTRIYEYAAPPPPQLSRLVTSMLKMRVEYTKWTKCQFINKLAPFLCHLSRATSTRWKTSFIYI
jgi:hypothetical protein